ATPRAPPRSTCPLVRPLIGFPQLRFELRHREADHGELPHERKRDEPVWPHEDDLIDVLVVPDRDGQHVVHADPVCELGSPSASRRHDEGHNDREQWNDHADTDCGPHHVTSGVVVMSELWWPRKDGATGVPIWAMKETQATGNCCKL